MAFSESGFDQFQFTILQHRERIVWAWRTGRFALQPTVVHYEGIAFTQDNGTFNDVLQLADIAGPAVGSQGLQRVPADMAQVPASGFSVTPDEIFHEQRNIFRSLSQRRNLDWKDV